MKRSLKVTLIQTAAGTDPVRNFEKVSSRIVRDADSDLILLPETFLYRGPREGNFRVFSFFKKTVEHWLKDFSRSHPELLLAAGTVLVPDSVTGKFFNRMFCFRNGRKLAVYDKINLFRISTSGRCIDEGEYIRAGKEPVLVSHKGWKIGLSICFDLRFPELYRCYAERKADLMVVPSNFLHRTGSKHWKILLRARAIENQSFVLATNQCGRIAPYDLAAFGHSIALDPDGKILLDLGKKEGSGTIVLEPFALDTVRGCLDSRPCALKKIR